MRVLATSLVLVALALPAAAQQDQGIGGIIKGLQDQLAPQQPPPDRARDRDRDRPYDDRDVRDRGSSGSSRMSFRNEQDMRDTERQLNDAQSRINEAQRRLNDHWREYETARRDFEGRHR